MTYVGEAAPSTNIGALGERLARGARFNVQTRILVVEDNKDLLDLFSRQLQWLGFRVSLARNGAEGVAMARAEHPDVILLDIIMPGMDGVEAVALIRANPSTREIPVLAVTGWIAANSRQKFLASGFTDYLAKPFTHKELLCAIEKLQRDAAGSRNQVTLSSTLCTDRIGS
jgi:CheY-like chemotaxis protein